MRNHCNTIRHVLSRINLFDTETDDEHLKRNEILSTRVYTVTLILILSLLTLYTSLQSQRNIITVTRPTQKQYEQLKLKYPNDLQCPCRQISTAYERFLSITARYNEICSSDFITQKWIDYLFYENTSYYFQLDFRHDASAKFQLLRSLCEQAQRTITDQLNGFYLLQFISNEVVPADVFNVQIHSFVELFKASALPSFQYLLQLIRQTTIANGLLSAIDTTFLYGFVTTNSSRLFLGDIFYYENYVNNQSFDCTCDEFTACQNPEGIYANIDLYHNPGSIWLDYPVFDPNTAEINATFLIDGMVAGCKPIESLLRSTSECLFEQQCLNQIALYINHSSTSIDSFSILNQSRSEKKNTTLETLAHNLFVEEWLVNASYEKYFDYCQPLSCRYVDHQTEGLIRICVTMISLYGGLRVVLRLTIPYIVKFIRRKKQQQQQSANTYGSKITYLWTLVRSLMKSIVKMNIFDKYSLDEHKQKSGRIATRLYFLILTISLVVFYAYLSSEQQSKTMYTSNPTRTEFEQLKNQSVNDLYCPCSDISIKYSQFTHFNPTYHQVCSSVFVSNLWYNGYYIWNIPNACNYPSFANLASYYFSLLSTLCQSANQTIFNSLTQFNALELVTSEVVLESQFHNEVMSFIQLFKTSTLNSFKGSWNLMQSINLNNQMASVKRTNVVPYVYSTGNDIEIYSRMLTHNNCTCGSNPTCHEKVAFCNAGNWSYITGMFIACYIVDSLLISTTACFFDQTCLDIIKGYVIQSTDLYEQISILNGSQASVYSTNETIGTIVENLFIENWNEVHSYEDYYTQCAPSFCSFTIQVKAEFVSILTRVIGIYGGLTIILGFLIPSLVYFIRRKQTVPASLQANRMNTLFQLTKTKLSNLNLFEDRSTSHETIRRQILTTRLYILVFVIILCALGLFTSLNARSITVTVPLSSLTEYQRLEVKYKTTLTCPCDEIAIVYEEFVNLQFDYHEICSSDFVSQRWFKFLYNAQRINDRNFRATASAQFQFLGSLCKLTQETMNISLIQFYSTKLISGQVISNDTFQKQVDSIVDIFQKSVPQTFKRTLEMIQEILHGNFYMSTYQTNWKFTVLDREAAAPLYTNPLTYNSSCSCGTSFKCFESVILNGSIIDGLVSGCYPVQSLLQSSLQCLYNQTCLEFLTSYFEVEAMNLTFKTLSSINEYGVDEQVEHMVDRFFVDQWDINRSYENYFQQCHPTFCTYSYIENWNTFYMITTVLGLYGGLTIVLKLTIPFVIHVLLRLFRRRRIFIAPARPTYDEETG